MFFWSSGHSDYKGAARQLPFIWILGFGVIFIVLTVVLFLLKIIFASGLFFGLFFIFFILPALLRMFFAFFLKFLAFFLTKNSKEEPAGHKSKPVEDVIDVAYEVVK